MDDHAQMYPNFLQTETKPIFTIGIPEEGFEEFVTNALGSIKATLEGYHLLTYSHEGEGIKFECFNAKDLKELDFEALKKELVELIK